MQAGREIKFRGKRKDNGEWVYGYIWIIPVLQIHYILTGKINVRDCSIEKYEVDPASVGQFTGICDKDGKEIYEGDKLFAMYAGEQEFGRVVYDDQHAMFKVITNDTVWSLFEFIDSTTEVIGNIYEEPESLRAT